MKKSEYTLPMSSPIRYIVLLLMLVLLVFSFVDIVPVIRYPIDEFMFGEEVGFVVSGPDSAEQADRYVELREESYKNPFFMVIIATELACAVFCLCSFTVKKPWLFAYPVLLYAIALLPELGFVLPILMVVGAALFYLTARGFFRTKILLITVFVILMLLYSLAGLALTADVTNMMISGAAPSTITGEDYIYIPGMCLAMLMLAVALKRKSEYRPRPISERT